MKRINTRQLNREFKKIVEDLPVIITVRGEDKYILSKFNSEFKPSIKPELEIKSPPPLETPPPHPLETMPPPPLFNKDTKLEELRKKTETVISKKPTIGPKKYSKLNRTKKPEQFCPKHGARLIGWKFTCGCIPK